MQGNPTPTPQSIGAQPADALLSALVALAGTGILEKTGTGTAGTAPIGTIGRDLLVTATQAEARESIGVEIPTSGTYSPIITVSGTGSVTMSILAKGWWRRTGNWVNFEARLNTASVSSPTGEVRFSIPFTADLTTYGAWTCNAGAGASWGTAPARLAAIINATTFGRLYANDLNAAYAAVQGTTLSTASNANDLFISGSYLAVAA